MICRRFELGPKEIQKVFMDDLYLYAAKQQAKAVNSATAGCDESMMRQEVVVPEAPNAAHAEPTARAERRDDSIERHSVMEGVIYKGVNPDGSPKWVDEALIKAMKLFDVDYVECESGKKPKAVAPAPPPNEQDKPITGGIPSGKVIPLSKVGSGGGPSVEWHRTAMNLFRSKRYYEALDALEKSMRHPPYEAGETKSVSMEGIDDVHIGATEAWNRCALCVSSLRCEGKLEEALDAARKALKLAEDLGEDGLADVAASLNILGEVYYEMQDLKMAQALFQRSLALRVRTLGRYHPEVAECIQNIEKCLNPMPLDMKTREQCRALSALALRIRVKAYGRNHPLVALSLMELARAYLAQYDHAKSLVCARNAVDIYEKKLGESHELTLATRKNISVIQDDLDELEEMIRLEEEDPLAPDDVAGLLNRWSRRSPRLAKGQNEE